MKPLASCFTPGVLEPEPLDVGDAAHGHEDLVGLEHGGLAVLVLDRDLGGAALLEGHGAVAQVELDAERLEAPREGLAHLGVVLAEELGEELHHGHLGAELAVDAAELQAHVPAADDDELPRNLLQGEGLLGPDDGLPVAREARKVEGHRTRGDDGLLELDHLNAVGPRHLHLPVADEACPAAHDLGAVLGAERLHAAREALDDAVLPGDDAWAGRGRPSPR